MDTIEASAAPDTSVVPLGTIRRLNRNLHIKHDTSEANGTRFTLALFCDGEPSDLGTVTIYRDADAPERDWLPAAKAIGISAGWIVESGIIKCLRSLARAIVYGETVAADHGFVKASDCPYPFAVEELTPWRG